MASGKLIDVEDVPEDSFAQLWEWIGKVPLDRIRATPAPGTANESDVVRFLEAANKRLYELVDGTLVEKPMGTKEALIAGLILHRVLGFLDENDRGIALGADGAVRLMPGLIRIPDVSFIAWEKMPNGVPDAPIADLVPDLAVEVLSAGNTKAEMRRKLRDYFLAGVSLAWLIDPPTETAEVYRAPDRKRRVARGGVLTGGDVLPGFELSHKEIFGRVKGGRLKR